MTLVEKFYAGNQVGGIVRFADGTLPTADELDRLLAAAYIFESTRNRTNEERERVARLPRCPHCQSILS